MTDLTPARLREIAEAIPAEVFHDAGIAKADVLSRLEAREAVVEQGRVAVNELMRTVEVYCPDSEAWDGPTCGRRFLATLEALDADA